MSQIRQIIYVSSSLAELNTDALNQILSVARSNNEKNDVTGVLLYHLGIFLQVLEGAESTIDKLFSTISADKRHKRVIVLSDELIESRDFDNWRMGYINVKDNPPKGLVDLLTFYSNEELALIKDGRAKSLLLSFKNTHSNSIL
ncbi:BLUF domain-containing protein [Aliikangiella marina]|nr:BLUF domain-containing protein [Aliikangiella marina]